MSDIQVAFPKVETGDPLLVPQAPIGQASTGLATIAAQPVAVARQSLICKDLLTGSSRADAEEEAKKLFPEMVGNTSTFMEYGTGALVGVNALIDRLLHDVEPIKIEEMRAIVGGLYTNMRHMGKKYDVSDPKVRAKYEHWKGGVGRFFGRARTLLDLLMADVTSIEHQLDAVEEKLNKTKLNLLRNVGYYDELYIENEAEILKLIYAIGVMELVRDLAANKTASIVVGDANLGDRQGELKATLAQFVSNMDIKIAEYKSRLFVAWSTSPQVRTMRTLDIGLAERENELVHTTLPTMKATLVQWRLLAQGIEAAEFAKQVAAASNAVLQGYAKAAEIGVPIIAEAVQTPTLSVETIGVMANSIANQAHSVVAAMDHGKQMRADLDNAILSAKGVLDSAAKEVSDKAIESILQTATKPIHVTSTVIASETNN